MISDACRLDPGQRAVVEAQIAETCQFKSWQLHAVNYRSNHVHAVVTAAVHPKTVCEQLKAWCTRRLKEHQRRMLAAGDDIRAHWWTERGSCRWINDPTSFEAAIFYVCEAQDDSRRFAD